MSKHFRWCLVLSGGVCGLCGCEAAEDTEPFVASNPGAVQPEAGGDGISEAEACQQLLDARKEAREQHDCEAERLGCPELIRPLASDPCERYLYDEESLDACVDEISEYASCADFDRKPCLVTALVQEDAVCEAGSGSGGSAGQGPTSGSGGSGGSSGVGGTGGSDAGQAGGAGQAGAAGASG